MPADNYDDPNLPVRVLAVDEADPGELEPPARAIEITLRLAGEKIFLAYGLHLCDGSHIVTTDGLVPAAVLKKASEITGQWVTGTFPVPFVAESSADS